MKPNRRTFIIASVVVAVLFAAGAVYAYIKLPSIMATAYTATKLDSIQSSFDIANAQLEYPLTEFGIRDNKDRSLTAPQYCEASYPPSVERRRFMCSAYIHATKRFKEDVLSAQQLWLSKLGTAMIQHGWTVSDDSFSQQRTIASAISDLGKFKTNEYYTFEKVIGEFDCSLDVNTSADPTSTAAQGPYLTVVTLECGKMMEL